MSREQRAAWSFSASLVVVGLALVAPVLDLTVAYTPPFELHWIGLAVAFAAAERFSVNLETRREAHALTFSEIPLTIGLVFAQPGPLLLARVVGAAVALTFVRRMPPVKVVFNVGVFTVEAGAAILIFHTLLGRADPVEPAGWAAAFAAVGFSHVVSWVCVTTVLRLAGSPVTLRSAASVLYVSGASVLAATAVALGAASALWGDARSWILLLVIGAALGYFFLSFVRIRERHQAMYALHEFTSSLDSSTAVEDVVGATVVGIGSLLKGRRVVAYVPSGEQMHCYTVEDGEVRRTVQDDGVRRQLAVASAWIEDRKLSQVAAALGLDTGEDTVAARLTVLDGDGLLVVDGRLSDARHFDDEDLRLLETAAGHASSALQNAQLVERLRQEANFRARQALHDDTTDLPNARGLVERLAEQLGQGNRLIVLTLRVHSLREVNETLGRSVGDEMLRQVAERLTVEERAWCARSGTDEFTVVVPGGQADADAVAARLVDAFEQPVLCGEVSLAVTVGIGVALAPQHGTAAEMLVRRASLAASRSTIEGTTVTTWAADRDPYDPQRLTIAADLRDAIPRGELEVQFQPQVDMRTGDIVGAEALVRWAHPRLGQLRPDQFIAAAEHTGVIGALTSHVLTVAAETGQRWHERGWDLEMAVNLSARNLASPGFATEVAEILDRTGFPAASLTLELTESSVMTEAGRALATLDELSALGVTISIDDFGTGYSSLAHLRRLPVNEIKIDKSFVLDLTTNESDEAIVRSMVELGHTLSLRVVVEGVETVEVRDRLEKIGSDRLQGYLVSRPLAAPAFEHWLQERRVRPARDTGRVVALQPRRGQTSGQG